MSKQPPLEIGFTPVGEYVEDPSERFAFWDCPSTVEWFRGYGYTLYQRTIEPGGWVSNCTVPVSITENLVEDAYPYAYHDTKRFTNGVAALLVEEYAGKVVFAQDSQQRHVAIKLVRAGSDEERILRFLREQSLDTLRENCVIPVLDFLPADGFWFVVMPRWGDRMYCPRLQTYREVLQIMHSLLEAVTFLHRHNIIHRDIKFDNVLVNHFGDTSNTSANEVRYNMRYEGLLSYALFDFDFSIMAPLGTDKRRYRLPYHLSFWGSFNQPNDTQQGEFDYDPFAFDVGTLGVELCNNYQYYAKELPMLAPLLDRMTTRDIPNRFTAAEALEFFEARYSELSEDTLESTIYKLDGSVPYDEYDRWEHLPPEFAAKWVSYREPPTPWTTRMLRYVVSREWLPRYVVPRIRWFFSELWSSPRALVIHFFGIGVSGLSIKGRLG